jgi:1,2-diacylglycerol 3-alpha-glucosyltransferase
VKTTREKTVLLPCPGLGNVTRGYETFMEQCYRELAENGRFRLLLFKGGGAAKEGETLLPHLSRQSRPALWLQRAFGIRPYVTEQVTFFLTLLPHLKRLKPDLLYLSDEKLARLSLRFGRRLGLGYRILFRNGAPIGLPYPPYHHIHQLAPPHYDNAGRAGVEAARMTLLPNAVSIGRKFVPPSDEEKERLRAELALPQRRKIILSVAAADDFKRLDYLVGEVARLPGPRPYLLNLGYREGQAGRIEEMAAELLPGSFGFRSVAPAEMAAYYRCADVFVLPSVTECFGRATVEAMSEGLPCAAHDGDVQRYVLGEEGFFADFTREGECGTILRRLLHLQEDATERSRRHTSAYRRFSWEVLSEKYVEMLERALL